MRQKSIQIRELTQDDSLEELTSLINRAYAPVAAMGYRLAGTYQDVEQTRRRVSRGTCFIAVLDGVIVGTMSICPGFPNETCAYLARPNLAYRYQFAVAEELQGLGIGFMLRKQIEFFARDHGFTELGTDTAEGHTERLDSMTREGYVKVDRIQWPGEDFFSIVMVRQL
ncbi:GNAT family N-acetyltransferase [Cupriavidus sp. 30B13]|uniref:GNAT family N-acetyltransferase n=1 Tax=Cupriavidus sp. 30B13 TaxID=3384241 RepID=UPI003B908A22